MPQELLPPLVLADWWETRDRIHLYSRLIGEVRQRLTPKQKHWWHATLHTSAVGLTTTPIPAGNRTLEISFDFTTHLASVKTSRGDWHDIALEGQAPQLFYQAISASLEELDLAPALNQELHSGDDDIDYDEDAVERFWQALSQIDCWLKEFRSHFRGETSPVHLFPHHFDLAMTSFTGRIVPDQDPDDAEYADEQVSFGFATGDETVDEAYFYNSAYPFPDGLTDHPLPEGAIWSTDGFKGSLMTYDTVRKAADPKALLMSFWHAHLKAATSAMGL